MLRVDYMQVAQIRPNLPASAHSAMDKNPQSKKIPPAAKRALAEAKERRRRQQEYDRQNPRPAESGGRSGPEPTRYGDWERGGIISDF